jgi:hypothetical protein
MTKRWKDDEGNMQRAIEPDDDLMTIEEWKNSVKMGFFNKMDGSGSWVKDGKFMTTFVFDDVFGPVPEGATHVVWYSK